MKSVEEHLAELVRIPSVSRLSNRPIIDYARTTLEAAGWRFREIMYRDPADIEKVNLIAAPPGADIQKTAVDLAFVCHTDTVPFATDWARATDPFIKDGYLLGCGACDVKAFLACALTAVLAPASQPISKELRLVLTADEEIGCVGTTKLMDAGAIRPRRVLIGEPTSLHPARAGKGYCLAQVTVHGKEAHSAHPQQGASAIHAATDLIAEIREITKGMELDLNELFSPGFTTTNIGTIEGGTAKNIVAGRCTFQLEWRPLPGQDQEELVHRVRAAAERLKQASHENIRFDIRVMRTQPGFETPADARLVRQLEALSGKAAIAIPFGSEAPYFAAVAEEVVVFGPGDMRTAHSSRECVPVSELYSAMRIMQPLVRG